MTAPEPSSIPAGRFDARRLETVFDRCFRDSERAELRGGVEEPVYRPAVSESGYHRVYYRSDYFASALHEVAHWCIAGRDRRQLTDYGYWYAPDGRSPAQQRAFQSVESRPQALEWCFSIACRFNFRPSLDNLDGGEVDASSSDRFAQAIVGAAQDLQRRGLPARAQRFFSRIAAGIRYTDQSC